MSRINTGKTQVERLNYKRKRNLKDSENKLKQLEKILEILREREFDDSLVQKLYKREMSRNKRLRRLLTESEV